MIEHFYDFRFSALRHADLEHQEEADAPQAVSLKHHAVRSPTHAAVLDQLVDGGDARACYCTLTAAETHPRLLPTTLRRRRSSLRYGVITSAPEPQAVVAAQVVAINSAAVAEPATAGSALRATTLRREP